MSTEAQEGIKQKAYAEAMRYMENAKEVLKKAKKEDNFYGDSKYVRMACGTAYNGVLIALDAYLLLKDVAMPQKKRRSIEFYTSNVAQLDKKLLNYLNSVYQVLHLSGYYDGICDVRVVKIGFENAEQIIGKIKPKPVQEAAQELPQSRPSLLRRIYMLFA
ncbi:MAG: DUF5618 family protein [Prevotellaceae bacterium]|jgi:uncharacterized protein (UPF0332 family)|nr:DUF5618 family protein [Prevotellaceae bacterium]